MEARIADKNWIHCDPCEAAVDEPLIYQSWGKNITYIVAYDFEQSNAVDVTSSYTNDMELAWIRRSEEGHHNQSYIDDILAEASFNLTSYAKEIKSKYTSFL